MSLRDLYKAYVGNVYSDMRQGLRVPAGIFLRASVLCSVVYSISLAVTLLFLDFLFSFFIDIEPHALFDKSTWSVLILLVGMPFTPVGWVPFFYYRFIRGKIRLAWMRALMEAFMFSCLFALCFGGLSLLEGNKNDVSIGAAALLFTVSLAMALLFLLLETRRDVPWMRALLKSLMASYCVTAVFIAVAVLAFPAALVFTAPGGSVSLWTIAFYVVVFCTLWFPISLLNSRGKGGTRNENLFHPDWEKGRRKNTTRKPKAGMIFIRMTRCYSIPAMARAKPSAPNGCRSSTPSPTPMKWIGRAKRSATATRIPPRAVPSSLFMTSPVTVAVLLNIST